MLFIDSSGLKEQITENVKKDSRRGCTRVNPPLRTPLMTGSISACAVLISFRMVRGWFDPSSAVRLAQEKHSVLKFAVVISLLPMCWKRVMIVTTSQYYSSLWRLSVHTLRAYAQTLVSLLPIYKSWLVVASSLYSVIVNLVSWSCHVIVYDPTSVFLNLCIASAQSCSYNEGLVADCVLASVEFHTSQCP
ncbi:hypothetical protein Tco_0642224 [Tanacetum coccineum]